MQTFFVGRRPLIGMIHLGDLPGQRGFAGVDALRSRALADLRALQAGGIDAVLIENWKDESPGPTIEDEAEVAIREITQSVVSAASVPVGVNVLPNDHRAALSIAVAAGAAFIQLDVFVDRVRTDYSYSTAPSFEIHPDPVEVLACRRRLGAERVLVLGSVQPKHYTLLDPAKSLELSVREAVEAGADAVVVTGAATGSAPLRSCLERARTAAGACPVVLGSGLDPTNAAALLAVCDGAIVGTSLKSQDFLRVEVERVHSLVDAARKVPL